ncbi:MAG TPA: hypothetical protein VMY88_11420 [Acidimicrobiales bacterium]|nr:hypothetical protein [Acidimicrobiales bacterium]
MRSRIALAGLFLFALVAGGLAIPAQAAPTVFEGTLLFSGPADAGPTITDELACPGPGDLDGTFYKFIDLKADYKVFKLEGPPRLFTDPAGGTGIGDYDLDLYIYDAKCNLIAESVTSGPTEKTETKKPARFVIVNYYVGPHPNLPFKLQAANERIK